MSLSPENKAERAVEHFKFAHDCAFPFLSARHNSAYEIFRQIRPDEAEDNLEYDDPDYPYPEGN